MSQPSFDDYYYFYLVVKHGSFSAAATESGITKSKLSRRILDLETQFNVALIERSTRHFKVTPLGQEFFEQCRKIIEQAECAKGVLTKQRSELQGLIKVSCPNVMMTLQIRSLLNGFLKQHPKVDIELELTSRRVDILHDDVDLAIRTNFIDNEDSSVIVRDVVKTTHCLVVHPELLDGKKIEHFSQLHDYPSVVLGTKKTRYSWQLQHLHSHENLEIPLQPRVMCNDLAGVYYAVCDGLGIGDLPYITVEEDIANGKLIHLLPDWCSNLGVVQLVYSSRKGQRLAMEKLIDTLVEGLRSRADQHRGYLL